MATADEVRIPVVEETPSVEKALVSDGGVRVTTTTGIATGMANLELSSDTVTVTRVSIGKQVTEVPGSRTEGAVTIIPVLEERAVVEKRLFLVEEIRIERTSEVQKIEVPVDLRRQTAEIVRTEDQQQSEETS